MRGITKYSYIKLHFKSKTWRNTVLKLSHSSLTCININIALHCGFGANPGQNQCFIVFLIKLFLNLWNHLHHVSTSSIICSEMIFSIILVTNITQNWGFRPQFEHLLLHWIFFLTGYLSFFITRQRQSVYFSMWFHKNRNSYDMQLYLNFRKKWQERWNIYSLSYDHSKPNLKRLNLFFISRLLLPVDNKIISIIYLVDIWFIVILLLQDFISTHSTVQKSLKMTSEIMNSSNNLSTYKKKKYGKEQ